MKEALEKIAQKIDLSIEEADQCVSSMMSGDVSEADIEAFLIGLRAKGEQVDEVVGASRALRRHMTPIQSSFEDIVDTCGTGGAGTGTFNISTTAAIIAAASGARVAKHGNRKVSSKSGSADVLSELGVNIDASHETIERCLNDVGICFCFAQRLHPSMKHVGPVRQRLGVPTIFNLLGPLCNPAGAVYQVLGVGRAEIRSLIASALQQLGTRKAVVLHGNDGLCEISNADSTSVTLIEDGKTEELIWAPEDFGLGRTGRDELLAESPADSAKMIREVFDGKEGAVRDIAAMNAATAIWISGHAPNLVEATQMALHAIDSGKANETLNQLAEVSQS